MVSLLCREYPKFVRFGRMCGFWNADYADSPSAKRKLTRIRSNLGRVVSAIQKANFAIFGFYAAQREKQIRANRGPETSKTTFDI
jgi:hypothetical protein